MDEKTFNEIIRNDRWLEAKRINKQKWFKEHPVIKEINLNDILE